MMNHILDEMLNKENQEEMNIGITIEGDNRTDNDTFDGDKDRKNGYKNEGIIGLKHKKRINSTPIWPSELPDVFSFPDSFFQLQKDLDHSVMEYLIKMGYADAAKSFSKELNFEAKTNLENLNGKSPVGLDDDDDDDDDYDLDYDIEEEKEKDDDSIDRINDVFNRSKLPGIYSDKLVEMENQRCMIGIGSVCERKEIKKLILEGKIEEVISIINNKWPYFFKDFIILKLRLLHLQSIEMIRDFLHKDRSSLTNDEIIKMEENFFKKFVKFIEVKLSDPNVMRSERFIKDMELTMGLLSYGKFFKDGVLDERLPSDLKSLLDMSLRENIAISINKALLVYADGVTYTADLINGSDEELSSSKFASENANEGSGFSSKDSSIPGYGVGEDYPDDILLMNVEGIGNNGSNASRRGIRVLRRFDNSDTKLLQLVKLFIWSYQRRNFSNSSEEINGTSQTRLEKMASITLNH